MRKKLIVAGLLALVMAVMPMRVLAVEVGNDRACSQLSDAEALKAAGCPGGEDTVEVGKIVQNVINVVIAALGIVAVLFVVIGAAQYVTSQGDPAKTKRARDTIIYALLGVLLAVFAYAIVNFIISAIASNNGGGEATGGCIFCSSVLY